MARSWRTGRQRADQGLILGMRPSSSQPGAPPWVRGLFELLRHYSGLILPRTGCVPLLHPGATLPPVPRPSELLQSHPANSRASPASRLSLGPEEKPPKPPKPKGPQDTAPVFVLLPIGEENLCRGRKTRRGLLMALQRGHLLAKGHQGQREALARCPPQLSGKGPN